ncbi:MAG: MBL fold metallo-hydrolase [Promethearchaeota archaeon]
MKILDSIYMVEGRGFDSNMYLIVNDDKEITLIDTGHDEDRKYLLDYIENIGLKPDNITDIILTHVHVDHSGGLKVLVDKFGSRVHVFEKEADAIEKGDLTVTLAGMFKGYFDAVKVDHVMKEGEIYSFGAYNFKIINTPGHTAGSICLLEEKNGILISGDTVFADGSFGRIDFPTGDGNALVESLEKLAALNIDILLPGHMRSVIGGAKTHVARSARFCKMMLF